MTRVGGGEGRITTRASLVPACAILTYLLLRRSGYDCVRIQLERKKKKKKNEKKKENYFI